MSSYFEVHMDINKPPVGDASFSPPVPCTKNIYANALALPTDTTRGQRFCKRADRDDFFVERECNVPFNIDSWTGYYTPGT